jgi:hypothetical protein
MNSETGTQRPTVGGQKCSTGEKSFAKERTPQPETRQRRKRSGFQSPEPPPLEARQWNVINGAI